MRQFPAADTAQVWIDFDGTLSKRDVLDDLILSFASDDSWKQVEELWQAGRIGSRECLEREFALIRIDDDQLERFLHRVTLDIGAKPLIDCLRRFKVPHAVVSDGIDLFIRRALARTDIDGVEIRSNTIERKEMSMQLQCPYSDATCESQAAHCKCASILSLSREGRRSIYIGDGRSDLCPARKADLVYAKGVLAQTLAREEIAFRPFETLLDVVADLEREWSPPR